MLILVAPHFQTCTLHENYILVIYKIQCFACFHTFSGCVPEMSQTKSHDKLISLNLRRNQPDIEPSPER